jgi:hypothetical protein
MTEKKDTYQPRHMRRPLGKKGPDMLVQQNWAKNTTQRFTWYWITGEDVPWLQETWQFCCSTQTETEFESATGSDSQLTREIILPDHNSHLYLSFNESVENSAYHNLFLKESVFYDWQYIIQNFPTQPTVWRFFVITNIFVPAQMPTLGPYKSN